MVKRTTVFGLLKDRTMGEKTYLTADTGIPRFFQDFLQWFRITEWVHPNPAPPVCKIVYR